MENPKFVLAIDNSASILQGIDSTKLSDLLNEISAITDGMKLKNYDIYLRSLNNNLTDLSALTWHVEVTNLNELFKSIQSDFEGQNLDGVLLISDGIYNQGLSPAFASYPFQIFTIGVGDTIPKRDISLRKIYNNKLAYQGNKFPIVAEISNTGFGRNKIIARVMKNGSEISREAIEFTDNNQLRQVTFNLEATESGIQHYRVEVLPLEGEASVKNNYKDAYVEVIEGKEKILLVGLSPHPDMKAIAGVLEKNENYELEIHIPGLNDWKEEKYDLVIFHQAFDKYNKTNALITRFLDSETPLWLIAGNQTNINTFNQLNGVIQITVSRSQRDLVVPAFNRGFNRFSIEADNYQSSFADYPPVTVPFGKTELLQGAEVLLFQRVGSITTTKPLLSVFESGSKKVAVMLGEGFWQWRTTEFAKNDSQEAFDELITKLVQFLSAKDDKRRFRVYTTDTELSNFEDVVFEGEVYNDIYERVYGDEIFLTIEDEQGKTSDYSFVTSNANSRFRVKGLERGIYKFKATTLINGGSESALGQFLVSELQFEALDLTADHSMLRKLSEDSGGKFYRPGDIETLQNELMNRDAKSTIYSTENFLPLINLKWPFFILLILISCEWFVRKYNGAY
ncbi:MAG: VWA domain-containing protein [Bacteroidetes bacterium]|nr:VWA domain-containing protein [Bacteroidota bacterium]MDA1119063.1 VWA domain-containing protein [Bacteroidota bacterium]